MFRECMKYPKKSYQLRHSTSSSLLFEQIIKNNFPHTQPERMENDKLFALIKPPKKCAVLGHQPNSRFLCVCNNLHLFCVMQSQITQYMAFVPTQAVDKQWSTQLLFHVVVRPEDNDKGRQSNMGRIWTHYSHRGDRIFEVAHMQLSNQIKLNIKDTRFVFKISDICTLLLKIPAVVQHN